MGTASQDPTPSAGSANAAPQDPQGTYPPGTYPGPAGYPQGGYAPADQQGYGAAPVDSNPQQGTYPQQQYLPQLAQPKQPGAVSALFDFSFQSFVTPRMVKTIYALAFVVLIGGWVLSIVAAASAGVMAGFFAVLLGWIPVVFGIALVRVGLEAVLALVKISERADSAEARAVQAQQAVEAEAAEADAGEATP